MLNKNTPGIKKREAKSEAPVSSYSYTHQKSVISGGGQSPSCLLATMKDQLISEGLVSLIRCVTV